MILSPLLRLQLRPKLSCWLKTSRNIRPSIKVGKDRFQLQLDVRNFTKDEIRVKARPEYVIIEGKQEKKTKNGLIMRKFTRKFKLPTGCTPAGMESKLSPDGILTITAVRNSCEENLPCETVIPVKRTVEPQNEDVSFIPLQDIPTDRKDPCAAILGKEATSGDKKPSSDITKSSCDDKKTSPNDKKTPSVK